jgi:hypothetical protein
MGSACSPGDRDVSCAFTCDVRFRTTVVTVCASEYHVHVKGGIAQVGAAVGKACGGSCKTNGTTTFKKALFTAGQRRTSGLSQLLLCKAIIHSFGRVLNLQVSAGIDTNRIRQ